jgi:apolipoprotein N-acyltransferase
VRRPSLSLVGALLLGALHGLAFAPVPFPAWLLPFVQIAAFAGLCALTWRAASVPRATVLGFVFGMGHFGVGISWIYTSLHVYAHMAAPLAVMGVVLLSAYLSIFPAAATAFARWVAKAPGVDDAARDRTSVATASGTLVLPPARLPTRWTALIAAVSMATAWTAAEWVRGVLFTGFPWLNAGYAHVDGPLQGWAALAGVYGVAFLATLTAGGIAASVLWSRGPRAVSASSGPALQATDAALVLTPGPDASATVPSPALHAIDARRGAGLPLALAVLICVLGAGAGRVSWVTPHGDPITVRLVQANIPLDDKFDPAFIWQGMDAHRRLAEMPTANGRPIDLTLLPETAVPVFQDQLTPAAWGEWVGSAAAAKSTFVLGVALRDVRPDREYFYNGVVELDGNTPEDALVAGRPGHRYRKNHLVPFGEFVPPGFKWFVNAMVMPLGDFDRGAQRQRPFAIAGQHVAMNICYEDVFGEELLPAIRPWSGDDDDAPDQAPDDDADLEAGATILANVSNLAWFGDSLALPQHLQMSRMRVRETERPMLRATNTGMTAVIDATGNVQSQLRPLTVGALDATVQGTTGLTPYARTGNAPVLGVLLALLAFFTWRRKRHKAPAQTKAARSARRS